MGGCMLGRLLIATSAILASVHMSLAEELKLTKLVVKSQLTAGVPYDVSFRYSGTPEGVREVCLLWSGEGPYCWSDFRVEKSARLIHTRARTGTPATYVLSGFVRFGNKETNVVTANIKVMPAK